MTNLSSELPYPVDFRSLQETQPWLTTFSRTCAIGFAILDTQMRYQFINRALADAHGLPAEAHLGRGMREILGEVALLIEPVFHRVQASGEASSTDVFGRLPHRPSRIYAIGCFFPLQALHNRSMGALVVDATELNQVERFLAQQTNDLARKEEKETLRLAQELHGTTRDYAKALMAALTGMGKQIWRLEQNVDKQLALMIASLDQRIADMRKVVATVAARLPKEEGR